MSYRQRMRGRLRIIAAFLQISFLATAFFYASTDVVVAQTRQLNIPTGDLTAALNRLAAQTGLQILFPAELANGRRTAGVHGSYTASEALSLILTGTGLTYGISGNVVTIDDRLAAASLGTDDGTLVLDPIDVSNDVGSGYQGTPDWVYQTPSSVSVISEEAIKNASIRDTRDLLNTASGVYAGEGQGSFPTVSPNVRGLQDSGRIVVSIDGARQNAQEGGRYGASSLSNFGMAMVDSAFIREIEIDKNTDSVAGYAGSLGGRVDFRTVDPDDIIKPGLNWGTEISATTGSNEYNYRASIVSAARFHDGVSVLAGLSGLGLGEYKGGTHGEEGGSYNSLKSREAWSSLLKVNGDFGDISTSVSWLHQENDYGYSTGGLAYLNSFYSRVDSATAKLDWEPENPLIDFKGRFWFNHAQTDETRSPRPSVPETYIDKSFKSFGGSLENTSVLDILAGPLSLNYGFEAFRDDATKSADSETIADNPLYTTRYGTFTPPGQRDIASAFAKATWEPKDWMTVYGGLRYDWYRLKGTPTYTQFHRQVSETRYVECAMSYYDYQVSTGFDFDALPDVIRDNIIAAWQGICGDVIDGYWRDEGAQYQYIVSPSYYETHEAELTRSDGAWLPSLTVEFEPTDWFKPCASYTHSFRPPTITEAFISGGLGPGDSIGYDIAPNPYLEPETARTWEIGANVSFDGLFLETDRVRFKAAAFYREIEDYIVMGYITTPEALGTEYMSFVNLDGTTRMAGVELEGNYDAGVFWLGGAFTFLKTKWPNKTDVYGNGSVITDCRQYDTCGSTTTSGEIFAISGNVPPRFKVSVDTGLRLLDQKITLGTRINHVTPTLSKELDEDGNLVEIRKPYTTVDLYSSFRLNDSATLRLGVNNLTDAKYVSATGNYLAPGRTYLGSLDLKF